MFGLPALGGQAGASNYRIDDALKDAIAKEPRAVVVTLEDETLTLSFILDQQTSLEEDFAVLQKQLTAACIVLFREEKKWNLLSWTPAGTGVKKRTMYASSHGQLKNLLPTKCGKEYSMVDPEDMTADAYIEHYRETTADERFACMTREEQERMEVSETIAREQAAQPQRLAGLGSVKAPIAEEWKRNLPTSLSTGGYSILTLRDNVLDGLFHSSGVAKVSDFKGKLTDPGYVIWQQDENIVLFLLWTPDVTAKEMRVQKMSLTSFKSNFLEELRALLPEKEIVVGEAHDDDDLDNFQVAGARSEKAVEAKAVPEAEPKKWKPPAGAFALPGFPMK